jgi:hypothetical protein
MLSRRAVVHGNLWQIVEIVEIVLFSFRPGNETREVFRHAKIFQILAVQFSEDVVVDDFVACTERDDLVGVFYNHMRQPRVEQLRSSWDGRCVW